MKKVIRICDAVNNTLGRAVHWLTLLLVLATVSDVALRYLFHAGSIKVQELEWHIFALIFLLGAGYTLQEEAHVRVDIFYARFRPRMQAAVDFIGALVFLIPFCVLVIWTSVPFVQSSYEMMECSADPGGLPFRFIIKAVIPLGFSFLALAGVSQLLKSAVLLFGGREAK